MVVTDLPATSETCVWQENARLPSICTMQAPHNPVPQPNLVPVSFRPSRITHNSGVVGGASVDAALPFTVKLVAIASSLGPHRAEAVASPLLPGQILGCTFSDAPTELAKEIERIIGYEGGMGGDVFHITVRLRRGSDRENSFRRADTWCSFANARQSEPPCPLRGKARRPRSSG